ncbi:MAG: hypothetical protein ACM3X3_04120 [Betaproteobacteria bacterium]
MLACKPAVRGPADGHLDWLKDLLRETKKAVHGQDLYRYLGFDGAFQKDRSEGQPKRAPSGDARSPRDPDRSSKAEIAPDPKAGLQLSG